MGVALVLRVVVCVVLLTGGDVESGRTGECWKKASGLSYMIKHTHTLSSPLSLLV